MSAILIRHAWILAALLVIAVGSLGYFVPRAGAVTAALLAGLGFTILGAGWWIGRNASLDSSEGFTALAMIVVAGGLIVLGAVAGVAAWIGW